MTLPMNRLLAIKAAAAGPYRIAGKCFDCGEEEGLVNFPRPFMVAIAICRRCRFARTGIEDRRGMIQATATISSPGELADGTTTCPSSGRDYTPAPDIRPPRATFARAIVPESMRSPSLDVDLEADRQIAAEEYDDLDDDTDLDSDW